MNHIIISLRPFLKLDASISASRIYKINILKIIEVKLYRFKSYKRASASYKRKCHRALIHIRARWHLRFHVSWSHWPLTWSLIEFSLFMYDRIRAKVHGDLQI